MKKYLILVCLCINSVVGGKIWGEEFGNEFSRNTQRSVFPSITGQPRCTQTLRDPDFPCSTVQSPIIKAWRGEQPKNAPRELKKQKGPIGKIYFPITRETSYVSQNPLSFKTRKNPLPSHIYTEKKIEESNERILFFDMSRVMNNMLINETYPLNKKRDLFFEKKIVIQWDGNRQRGHDNKMDYLFLQDNEVYKE